MLLQPQRGTSGVVVQLLDASPFQGKHIIFSAFAKADIEPPISNAQLIIRIELEKDSVYYTGFMDDNPITKNEWKEYSIEADVPDSAKIVRLGMELIGEGKAWFDNTKITIIDKDSNVGYAYPRNADFEEGDSKKLAFGWKMQAASENGGYDADIDKDNFESGKKSLLISSDEKTKVKAPKKR